MQGFFYFLANYKGPIDSSVLFDYGLEHIGPAKEIVSREVVANGPEGLAGMVACHKSVSTNPKMTGELQSQVMPRFKPACPLDDSQREPKRAFCLYLPDALPSDPRVLQRDQIADGVHAKMHDGSQWLIPIARQLPRVYQLDPETGRLREQDVEPVYETLWQTVQHWLEFVRENGNERYPYYDWVLETAFSTNYRVSLTELSLMRVLGRGVVDTVIEALLDIDSEAMLKKSQDLDSGNGSDGADRFLQDNPANTPPA